MRGAEQRKGHGSCHDQLATACLLWVILCRARCSPAFRCPSGRPAAAQPSGCAGGGAWRRRPAERAHGPGAQPVGCRYLSRDAAAGALGQAAAARVPSSAAHHVPRLGSSRSTAACVASSAAQHLPGLASSRATLDTTPPSPAPLLWLAPPQAAPSLTDQYEYAQTRGIPWLVIIQASTFGGGLGGAGRLGG